MKPVVSPMAHSRVWEQELSPGPVIPRPESAGLGEIDVESGKKGGSMGGGRQQKVSCTELSART